VPTAPTIASTPTGVGVTPGSPSYTVTVALTGKDQLGGTFAAHPGGNPSSNGCAVVSELSGTLGANRIDLQINTSAPAGQPAVLSPGDLNLIIDADNWGVGSSANAPQGTTGTLERRPDGSGSLTFANLYLQSNPAQEPQESGTVRWTCEG